MAIVSTIVAITVRPVGITVVTIPRISLGISVGARFSRGSLISRSLSVVTISMAIVSTIVAIAVRPVGITVISVPRVSLGIGVGARFGRGGLISRSLSVVTISIRSAIVTSVSSPMSTVAVIAVPGVSLSL